MNSLTKGDKEFEMKRRGYNSLSCTPNTKKTNYGESTSVFNSGKIDFSQIRNANRGNMTKLLMSYDESLRN